MTELKAYDVEECRKAQYDKIENRMLICMVRQNGRTALLKKWEELWIQAIEAWNRRAEKK